MGYSVLLILMVKSRWATPWKDKGRIKPNYFDISLSLGAALLSLLAKLHSAGQTIGIVPTSRPIAAGARGRLRTESCLLEEEKRGERVSAVSIWPPIKLRILPDNVIIPVQLK